MLVPNNTVVVPERSIRLSAKHAGGRENTFSKLLDKAKVFRSQGLTPVYLWDQVLSLIELSTEEKLSKKLN